MTEKTRFEISRQLHDCNYCMHSAHYHSYYELYYLVDGKCNLLIHDCVYSITPGCITLISPNTLHKTTYTGNINSERVYIEFTSDYITYIVNTFGKEWLDKHIFNRIILLDNALTITINSLLCNIAAEKNMNDHCSVPIITTYFQELILLLIRCYENSNCSIYNSKIKVADPVIAQAIKYISDNYMYNINLNLVAAELHLNSSYLSRKFKTVNGIGFSEYLNMIRINHAEQLLLETDESITDIAMYCGYESSNYFGDIFRKINKISPSEFRRINNNP